MLKAYLKGWLYWQLLRLKLKIDYHKVVIVLTDENRNLDRYVLAHLEDFMDRKYANQAVLMCTEGREEELASSYECEEWVRIHAIGEAQMELLYSFYSFMKFFDNIVFTYTESPKDNLLKRFLDETNVNEEDAACLALYHLRYVSKA